eukprot:TRINITY_DN1610_c0_g2_i1.p2 TRINITY_DN1610_c0_g2~~TRINITY_DN1610_c0_g2_i1.p2  ORF type:complete len:138 (+),score=21.71 TRINITY_DN1610_c0_g2_i1:143-556(+)
MCIRDRSTQSTWEAIIMQITDKNLAYAKEIYQQLDKAGYRVELDARNEKVGYKIREAQMQKIPYMLILGDKEMEDGSVSVRLRKTGETKVMTLLEFIAMVNAEVAARIQSLRTQNKASRFLQAQRFFALPSVLLLLN